MLKHVVPLGVLSVMLAACGSTYKAERPLNAKEHIQHAVKHENDIPRQVKVGRPYKIKGITYKPHYNPNYREYGVASWYGPGFHGKDTANGETYNQYDLTAAHRTLPLPSLVRVTNRENGKTIIVRVNDRGPFAKGRIIDLSKRAAEMLDMRQAGVAPVRVDYLEADTRQLWASLDLKKQPQQAPARHYAEAAPQPLIQVAALDEPAAFAPVVKQHHNTSGFVQAGSFSSLDNAERFAKTLSHIGSVSVKPVTISDGRLFYRVQMLPRDGQSLGSVQQQLFDLGVLDAKIQTR